MMNFMVVVISELDGVCVMVDGEIRVQLYKT